MELKAILYAFLAAVFYAINIPASKILLRDVGPTTMAALLYLGAGAVVTHDIPDNALVFGVPARVVRKIEPSLSKAISNGHREPHGQVGIAELHRGIGAVK